MGGASVRTGSTTKGILALSPWSYRDCAYALAQINLGNNSISKLEIVSSLNSFNLTRLMYHFNYENCAKKYNPKVYFGTIQTASKNWNNDNNSGLKSEQKSGSLAM